MKTSSHAAAALALLALCRPDYAHAQVRAKADVTCKPAGTPLQYDCIIKLINPRSNEPLSGVTLAVGADMPSMPGVHHLRPVPAAEDQEKGTYRARLVLDMHGDWALQLDLSGRIRDRVVKLLRFEDDHVGEAKPSRERAPRRH